MYKTNRQNHDFQLAYFVAGSCHTPDGMYAILCDQKADRELALNTARAAELKRKASRLRASKKLESQDEAEVLDGQAELLEIEAFDKIVADNIAGAQAELKFINECIERVQPHRKYSHLTDAESHEAAQAEEWKLELIRRAENQLLTTGTISPDHFATMRLHPEFKLAILPAINEIRCLLNTEGGALKLQERISNGYALQIER